MTINEKIKELIYSNKDILLAPEFRGKNDPPRLVYDGIVDDTFSCAALFLLKESTESGATRDFINNPSNYVEAEFPDGHWDFIKSTNRVAKKQERRPENWDTICYWTEALLHPEKPYCYSKECGENLRKVALVNLKKTTGESTSDPRLLGKIARDVNYSKVLRNEIALIETPVVICSGTFEFAKALYGISPENTATMECGAQYFSCANKVFVEFIHPSQRGAAADKRISYAYAQTIFREGKQRGIF